MFDFLNGIFPKQIRSSSHRIELFCGIGKMTSQSLAITLAMKDYFIISSKEESLCHFHFYNSSGYISELWLHGAKFLLFALF